ncbi:MAG: DUF4625 domain-containing protein [Bacteroidota bacterium]
MKIYKSILIAVAAALLLLSSCSSDDDDKTAPIIENLEIGLNNSLEFYRGGDVHLEFEASDNEGLSHYSIEIHPESSLKTVWEYEKRWDFDENTKNALVHQHEIMIPENAATGAYHFHLTVVDINGNASFVEEEVHVHEAQAGDGPEIHVDSYPDDGQVFSTGETISIAGHVHSETSHIAGLFIGIVKEADALTDEEVDAGNSIVLFHEHDFELYEVAFDAQIYTGAAEDNNDPPGAVSSWDLGEAYILIKTQDEEGRWSYSQHYHIEVYGSK